MYNTNAINFEKELINLINANSELHVATIKLILDKVTNTINEVLIAELEKEESQNTQEKETNC